MKRILLVIFLFFAVAYRVFAQSCTLSVSVSSSSPAICSGNTITLTATTSAGTAPYLYVWNTGETTASINVNKVGTYTVTVTDNTAGCKPVSSSIKITQSTTPPLPTANDAVTCPNGSATLTATAPGGLYQWYDAAVGGNLLGTGAVFTTPSVTASKTYYVETTINGCTSPRKSVNVNVISTLTVRGATVCAGNTATLTASGADTYQWFDDKTAGNLVGTGPSFTTPALNATTVYYVVAASANGCTSNRTPVTAIVTPPPQDPTVQDVQICSGSRATLSVTSPVQGLVFNWYNVPTGGTSLIASPDYTTPALTASTTYYVQASSNGCLSARTPVNVIVNAIPPAPTIAGTTICAGTSATLTASGSSGNYNWYNSLTSRTPLATGNTFQTPVLTVTTTFYVEAINNSCNSVRTPVTVTVNDIPAAPTANNQIICSGSAATLTATTAAGNIEWYDAPTGGNLLVAGATFTTPALAANATYYVQSVVNNCPSARAVVQVSILPAPQAPAVDPVTVCSGDLATLTVKDAAGNYEWYDSPTGGNLLSSSATLVTPVLNATITYYVQAVSNGCPSSRTVVTVTVNPIPVLPTISGNQTVCEGNSTSLTANVSSGTVQWYSAATGGTLLATGNAFDTPNLKVNTTYYVQNIVNTCSSARVAVAINVIPIANSGFKYLSGTYCNTAPNPIPIVNTVGGTFSANPNGLSFVDINTGEINLSASLPGSYVVNYTTTGTCGIVATQRVVIGTSNAVFSYNASYCQNDNNPLPVFSPGSSAGTFSSTAGLVFVSTTTGEIDVARSTPGVYTVTNTISGGSGCIGDAKTATVTINAAPKVNAGPDQIAASGSPVQLAGTYSGVTGVKWSGGAGSFSNDVDPKAVYTPAAGETNVALTLTTTAGQCGSASNTMNITFRPVPGSPIAPGTTICSGNIATLAATGPGGNYEWFDAATGGTRLASTSYYVTPNLTATTTYFVQTTLGGITSARTPVTVTVNNIPAAPVVLPDTVCYNTSAMLKASGSPATYQWYDSAIGGNLLSTSDTYVTPVLINNITYYVEAINGTCESPRTPVNVIIKPVPEVTSLSAVSACSGSAIGYTIVSSLPNTTYLWSRAAVDNISNPAVDNQTTGVIKETLINTGNIPIDVPYTITPIANGCSGSPFKLLVTVFPAVTVTSSKTDTVCNSGSPDYTIAFSSNPSSFSWSRPAVPGISNAAVINQTAPTIREVLINTGNVPVNVKYNYTITSPSCPASTFQLTVTVNPVARVTSAAAGGICSGTAQHYVIQSNIPTATFNWSRAQVPNISNDAVTVQNSSVINETLISTSSNPVKVVYVITPYFDNCPGKPFAYVVTVTPQPAQPIANSNSPVCLGSTIKFNTVQIPGATYLWTGPNGFSSILQNPTIANVNKNRSGTYSLTITTNGCSSEAAMVDVVVNDPPLAKAGNDTTVCADVQGVQLNGMISRGTTTGVWTTFGTGKFSPSSDQLDAVYIPSPQDIQNGKVTLRLTSTSKDDCRPNFDDMIITILPNPVANAGGDKEVCSQDISVPLTASGSNYNSALWTTSGTGTFNPAATDINAIYMPSALDKQNGSVKLRLKLTGVAVCNAATDSVTVKFIPPPTVDAGKDITMLRGESIVLNPTISDPNVHYLWTPNLNINNNTLKNPTITADRDIVYTLMVTDSRGCVSEDQISIKVLDPIVVTNTITPNGDGINDVWNIPALSRYPEATVDIFNRNGEKIFHSIGYGKAWDGTYAGQPLPVGVYYYVIDTKFEGRIVSGYVTIIR